MTTVGQLKAFIEHLGDDTIVVSSTENGEFRYYNALKLSFFNPTCEYDRGIKGSNLSDIKHGPFTQLVVVLDGHF